MKDAKGAFPKTITASYNQAADKEDYVLYLETKGTEVWREWKESYAKY